MTREDAIAYLQYGEPYGTDYLDAIEVAVEALKAQEPRVMTDEELMDRIRKAPIMIKPAVDAAPVVHGEWKSVKAVGGPGYPYWDAKCSECGYTTKSTAGWLYCPHCGAKMDGDAHE